MIRALGYLPDDEAALNALPEFGELCEIFDKIPPLSVLATVERRFLRAHFDQEFIGTGAAEVFQFVGAIAKRYRLEKTNWYACYFALVQSSGWGKSRTLCQLARLNEKFYVIFVCFRKPGSTGFPPLLSWTDTLLSQLHTVRESNAAKTVDTAKAAGMIASVWYSFVRMIITLKHENRWSPTQLLHHLQQDALPAVRGSLLSEADLTEHYSSGEYTFLLAIDEASALLPAAGEDPKKSLFYGWRHMLRDMGSLIDLVGVLADTSSHVGNFAPTREQDHSDRVREGAHLFPVHYLLPADTMQSLTDGRLPPFSGYGTGDPHQLCLAYLQARPLFFGVMDIMSTKWQADTNYLKSLTTAFRVAIEKLLPHVVKPTPEQQATSYAACICARTSTPLMSTRFASDAVAHHLGTLLYVSDARDRMTVLYPPEPPVSAAATAILKHHGDARKRILTYASALSSFSDVVYDKLPLAGPMGELVQELRMLDGIDDARVEYVMDNPDLHTRSLAEQLGVAVPVQYVVKHWFPRIYDRVLGEMDPELARGKILVTKFARVRASMSELRRFGQDFLEGCLLSHMAITLVGNFPVIDFVIPVRLEDRVIADAPDTAGGEPCTPGGGSSGPAGDPTFRPRIALIQVQVKNQADLLSRAECVAYISRLARRETASNAFDMLNNLALTRLPRAARIEDEQAVPPAAPSGRLQAGKARGGASARSKRSDAASTADNARQNVALSIQGLPPKRRRQNANPWCKPPMPSDVKSLAEVKARSAAVAWNTPDSELIPTFFIVSQLAGGVRNDAEGRSKQLKSMQSDLETLKQVFSEHRARMGTAFAEFQARELEIAGKSAAPKAQVIAVTDEQHEALFERSLSPACDKQLAELKKKHATLYSEVLDMQTFIERSEHAMDGLLQASTRQQEQALSRVKAAADSKAFCDNQMDKSSSSENEEDAGSDDYTMIADADAGTHVSRLPPPPMSGDDQTPKGLRLRDVTFSDVMRRECNKRSIGYSVERYARGVFVFSEDSLACSGLSTANRPRGVPSEVAEQQFEMLRQVRVEPTDGVVNAIATGTCSSVNGLPLDKNDRVLLALKYCIRLTAGKPRSMHPLELFLVFSRRISGSAGVGTLRSVEMVSSHNIQQIDLSTELCFVDDGIYLSLSCETLQLSIA